MTTIIKLLTPKITFVIIEALELAMPGETDTQNRTSPETTMSKSVNSPSHTGKISVQAHGAVLVAHLDGGPHALFDAAMAEQLQALLLTHEPLSGRR